VLALITACDIEDVGRPDYTLDDVREDWADPAVDLAADTWIVDGGDGSVAAYALCRGDSQEVYVAAAQRGAGLGSALLAQVEARAAETARPLRQFIAASNAAAAVLLTSRGYAPTHHYWRMSMQLDAEPAEPQWPDGIAVRGFQVGEDDRAVHALVQAAFAEIEGNIHHDYDEWRTRSIETAVFDPALWFVAEADGALAGVLLGEVWAEDDLGWVGQLAVDPPWRGRGLGRALLLNALADFRRRGLTLAALSVHGGNDRASHLYESVGMRPAWRHDRYDRQR
jgi:mycothiol synthase